jgi:gibberellin 2beta-dioxygenase
MFRAYSLANFPLMTQAFSNNGFKSIIHRVVSTQEVERFSVAYFYCPSNDAVIESSCNNPSPAPVPAAVYKQFSFREYQQQVRKDVEATGDKVGLSRFLL